jgi:hypothetical protein
MQKNKLALILLTIILLLLGALIYLKLTYKKQVLNEKVKLSIAIDSVRVAVIDSMQQVLQNQVKEAISPIPTKLTPPIDIYNLINLFSPDASIDYELLDWKTEANNPAINWLTNGIDSDENGFFRNAEVVVSINKQVIECLDRNTYPCKWELTLLGSHGGYTSFEISTAQSQALEGLDVNDLFKGHKFEANILKTDEFKNETYLIKFPNKKPIEITFLWSCGSGGCSLNLKCETLINNHI